MNVRKLVYSKIFVSCFWVLAVVFSGSSEAQEQLLPENILGINLDAPSFPRINQEIPRNLETVTLDKMIAALRSGKPEQRVAVFHLIERVRDAINDPSSKDYPFAAYLSHWRMVVLDGTATKEQKDKFRALVEAMIDCIDTQRNELEKSIVGICELDLPIYDSDDKQSLLLRWQHSRLFKGLAP